MLLFLDIDNFKVINDSFGHSFGDDLLRTVSDRLVRCVRSEDTVTRFGGDEFTVLLTGEGVVALATATARRLLEVFVPPVRLHDQEVYISASIGVVTSEMSYQQPQEVLRDADIAMYRAKSEGRGRYRLFDPTMRDTAVNRMQLEIELRYALAEGQLEVHYQPIYLLGSRQIYGVEALVRWRHPERGLVSPVEFIPIAEETGLIRELDLFVLRTGCLQLAAWNSRHGTSYSLSVNVSGHQFTRPELVDEVARALHDSDLPPDVLHLEITETVLMSHGPRVSQVLGGLRALGVKVHLDDFGTGYSSLAYLQRFAVDRLKIDRSFIDDMLERQQSAELVRAILVMAKNLGLKVVAEGVETREQLEYLELLECDFAQGFLFARPLDAAGMEALLTNQVPPSSIAEAIPKAAPKAARAAGGGALGASSENAGGI